MQQIQDTKFYAYMKTERKKQPVDIVKVNKNHQAEVKKRLEFSKEQQKKLLTRNNYLTYT